MDSQLSILCPNHHFKLYSYVKIQTNLLYKYVNTLRDKSIRKLHEMVKTSLKSTLIFKTYVIVIPTPEAYKRNFLPEEKYKCHLTFSCGYLQILIQKRFTCPQVKKHQLCVLNYNKFCLFSTCEIACRQWHKLWQRHWQTCK